MSESLKQQFFDIHNQLVESSDPTVAQALEDERRRQNEGLELIASENFVTPAVMAAMGSVMTNKYAEGYPGRRYYGGCHYVDVAEDLARDRAKELFGADHANVQPHSGAQANMGVYLAVMNPGDTMLGMDLTHGGHLTHGHPLNYSGKEFDVVAYGVHRETETIDYERLRELALEHQPQAHRLRRVGLPEDHRFRAVARHRRRGRRADHGRHRAHRRLWWSPGSTPRRCPIAIS